MDTHRAGASAACAAGSHAGCALVAHSSTTTRTCVMPPLLDCGARRADGGEAAGRSGEESADTAMRMLEHVPLEAGAMGAACVLAAAPHVSPPYFTAPKVNTAASPPHAS